MEYYEKVVLKNSVVYLPVLKLVNLLGKLYTFNEVSIKDVIYFQENVKIY
jgi:hypothetical protein